MPPVEATRTGSFPAITERPSPPPPPPGGSTEWFGWAEKRFTALEREVFHASTTAAHVEQQIGRPPIPAAKDPGAGMWLTLADVRADCTTILAKLDAADKAAATRGGFAGRVGWKIMETIVPLAVIALLAYFAGFRRDSPQAPRLLQDQGAERLPVAPQRP